MSKVMAQAFYCSVCGARGVAGNWIHRYIRNGRCQYYCVDHAQLDLVVNPDLV